MSRRRDDRRYEEDDYRDGPRKANPAVWIVLAILGVGVVGVLLVGVAITLMWTRSAAQPVVAPPVSAAKKTYSREEFRTLVMGKTMDEVRAALGNPSRTSEPGGGNLYWEYFAATFDPETGKTDISAQLVFKNGKVASVNF